jgi:thiosulfate/3-mercaptopyruvate sulfurtransferase
MTKHSPLISPDALYAHLDDPDLRLVDVRWVLNQPGAGRAAYDAGHLPGAIFLDLDSDLAGANGPGRHPLPDPTTFRRRLEAAGISSSDEIVTYDDTGGTIAARLWWMLDDLGHERVALLDGGIAAWRAAGYPVTTEVPPARPPGRLTLRGTWTNVIDRESVAAGLGSLVVLDARAAPRYRGEVEPVDRIPGHIPTAINAPGSGNLGPDGRLLGADALATHYEQLGAAGTDARVVTSCGSGVTACLNSLAMRVAGLPDPLLYAGSYSDWTQSGLEAATGAEPGEPSRAAEPR